MLSLRIALGSLASHKLRTALAMLGVFLGALALTGVQHISLSMTRKAEIETEKLGPNLFMAVSGQLSFRRSGSASLSGMAMNFTEDDARALVVGIPSALRGAPFHTVPMDIRHAERKIPAQIVATTVDYPEVRSFRSETGRFFTPQEQKGRALVCVLGRDIAVSLFGNPQAALGRLVHVFRTPMRVVGVMEAKGRDISGANQDEQVFVPLQTFLRRLANQTWITGVFIRLAPGSSPDEAAESATTILRGRHRILPGEEDDFTVLAARDAMRLQREALELVNILGVISSSLSFAVGGLGILSMMVLLVRARRIEIGIRRAMGARRADIIRQFLFESGLMAASGGILGTLAAILLLPIVCVLGDFPFLLDPVLLLGTLAGSAALGLLAGAYPAWQASRLQVLDVLRSGG